MTDLKMSLEQPQQRLALGKEDEDEWEYEYSTAETETYYLTLDLSVRDFLDKIDENVLHSTRAGYRVWYNSLQNPATEDKDLEGDDGTNGPKATNANGDDDDDEEEDNDPLSEAVRQRRRPQETVEVEEQPKETPDRPAEQMQIMELHTPNPLVSYRGMVFRGSWAENIGTDMVFARHESEGGLQVLRNLPDNIDLLSASSTRINFKEVKLEMRGHGTSHKQSDRQWEEAATERYKENGGIYVHVGSDKHGYRRPQANFIEDLTVLKRKRGETDAVTVTTVETTRNDLFHDDLDEVQRRKKVKRDRARTRNLALNAGENKRGTRGRGRARRTGRAKGRGPPRGPTRAAGRSRLVEVTTPEQQLPRYDRTPSGWDKLELVPQSSQGVEDDRDSEEESSSVESDGSN